MKFFKIETGNFMCDGGAVFGSVPKIMWSKEYPCNDDNYCNFSMRCLLIDTGDRVILVDTGCGNKQSDKYFSYFFLNGDDTMPKSFAQAGYTFESVTDVVFTHLHFDHAGGAIHRNQDGNLQITFPNAQFWVGKSQYENLLHPNVREANAYFKDNIQLIFENGQLNCIEQNMFLTNDVELRIFNGHTFGQIVVIVNTPKGKLAYMGDVIPVMANIPLAWVAAYDLQPVVSMQEKEAFLNEAYEQNITLFFEHDLYNECCSLTQTARGIRRLNSFNLSDWLQS